MFIAAGRFVFHVEFFVLHKVVKFSCNPLQLHILHFKFTATVEHLLHLFLHLLIRVFILACLLTSKLMNGGVVVCRELMHALLKFSVLSFQLVAMVAHLQHLVKSLLGRVFNLACLLTDQLMNGSIVVGRELMHTLRHLNVLCLQVGDDVG